MTPHLEQRLFEIAEREGYEPASEYVHAMRLGAEAALEKAEPIADQVKFYYMADSHAFGKMDATTIDGIIQQAHEDAKRMEDAGMLCPVIVLAGGKELRRVGRGVHVDWQNGYQFYPDQLCAWKVAVLSDPDICRIMGWDKGAAQ